MKSNIGQAEKAVSKYQIIQLIQLIDLEEQWKLLNPSDKAIYKKKVKDLSITCLAG